jgi:hypothetical protein
MSTTRLGGWALALVFSTTIRAATFDGTAPLECTAERGHDCLIGGTQCRPLKPDTSVKPVFGIDFAARVVRSPFRTSLLKMSNLTENKESLVLQGADLQFAWSALIKKDSGALTVSVSDREGAYVVFGQCRPTKTGDD